MPKTRAAPVIRRVPAVSRAIAILQSLSRGDEPRSLNSLAQELKLIPSTCLHILRALAQDGLVLFDPTTKRYALDAGLLPIARAVIRQNNIVNLAQPYIDEFTRRHNLTTICVRLMGIERMVVVTKCDSVSPVRFHVDVGSRFPALISATGRCLAAFTDFPQKEVLSRWKAVRWDDPPTLDEWLADVERARQQRFSFDRNRYIAGSTVVSAPILNRSGVMTYALNTVGVSEQVRRIGVTILGRELSGAAKEIEAKMYEATARRHL